MNVLTLGSPDASRVALFAAGAGGDPDRHRPLLDRLAAHGCRVVAPCFERLLPGQMSTAELLTRPFGLVEALRESAPPDVPVAAVGHSIGAWAALCLAGATPWGPDGKPIDVPREPRICRLALYAPAAGWFRAPGALGAVTVPMLVYAGELDTITPVAEAIHFKTAPAPVDVRVMAKAGHFSFMNVPPPGTSEDPDFDRDQFLTRLADATTNFVTAP